MEQETKTSKQRVQEIFDKVKGLSEEMKDKDLENMIDSSLKMLQRFTITGQQRAAERVWFNIQNAKKEKGLIKLGYDKYIWKEEIDQFLDDNSEILVAELDQFMRPIPDEIIKKIEETNKFFSNYIVMFTDYTGRETKKIEAERRNADPILFGIFTEGAPHSIEYKMSERMYFIGDWVDEYCDLTLDKLSKKFKDAHDYDPVNKIDFPKNLEEWEARMTKEDKSSSIDARWISSTTSM